MIGRRRVILLSLVLWGVAAQRQAGGASGATTVAVLNFVQRTSGAEAEQYRWLEKGLADLVIADLSTRRGLTVVTREQMQLLSELHRIDERLVGHDKPDRDPGEGENNGPIDPELGRSVGSLMKARRVVFGSFAVERGNVNVHAQVLDSAGGRVLGTAEVTGRYEEVLGLEKELAGKIVAVLEGGGEPKEIRAQLPVWTDSIPATTHLYTGLDLFDGGHYPDAWVEFRAALRQDAAYADAGYWSARMYYYMTRYMHARPELKSFLERFPNHGRAGDAAIEYAHTFESLAESPSELEALYRELADTAPAGAKLHHLLSSVDAGVELRLWLLIRLAQTLVSQGRYADAFVCYDTVMQESVRGNRELWLFSYNTTRYFADRARNETGQIFHSPIQGRSLIYVTLTPEKSTYRQELPRPLLQRVIDQGTRHKILCSDGYALDSVEVTFDFHYDLNYPLCGAFLPIHKYYYIDIEGVNVRMADHAGSDAKVGAATAAKTVKLPVGCNSFQFKPEFRTGGDVYRRDCLARLDEFSVKANLVETGPTGLLDVRLDHAENFKTFLGGRYLRSYSGLLCNIPAGQYDVRVEEIPSQSCRWMGESFRTFVPHESTVRVDADQLTQLDVRPEFTKEMKARGFQTPVGVVKEYPTFKVRPRRLFKGHDVGLRPAAVYDPDAKRWVCVWSRWDDLWLVTSRDGRDWTPPSSLPTPLNSAHREFMPRLLHCEDGYFRIAFVSDRNHRRDYALYVSRSKDLTHWTGPRMISREPVMTIELAQARDGRYLLVTSPLSWPRAGLAMLESADFENWSRSRAIVPSLSGTYAISMRLRQDRTGRFHLVFASPQPTYMERHAAVAPSGKIWGMLGHTTSDDLRTWSDVRLLDLGTRFWVESVDSVLLGDRLVATVSSKDRTYGQVERIRFLTRPISDPGADWSDVGEVILDAINHRLAAHDDTLLWTWISVDYDANPHKHDGKVCAMLIDADKLLGAVRPREGGP